MILNQEKFQQIYDPTIEEKYTKILSVDGQEVTLDILDTAGQKEFQSMEQFWFREGEIFLIVYSIDSMKTFEEISHFARKVSIAKQFDLSELTTGHSKDMPEDNKKPFIIVGNKWYTPYTRCCGLTFSSIVSIHFRF